MSNQAFRILGIAPTEDGRAIRAAFLRLAKIYHPDRFVDMPDDVREEAERRMKEATIAYESLRATKKDVPAADAEDQIDEKELKKRALKFREVAARKREKEQQDREKWDRWQRVEEIARKKAKLEADMAARVADEVDGSPASGNGAPPPEPKPMKPPKQPMTRETLAARLDAVRRGEQSPLVKRS